MPKRDPVRPENVFLANDSEETHFGMLLLEGCRESGETGRPEVGELEACGTGESPSTSIWPIAVRRPLLRLKAAARCTVSCVGNIRT